MIKDVIQGPNYPIEITEEAWQHAINHQGMAENYPAVIDALTDPVAIYASDEFPEKRDVYFGKSDLATYSNAVSYTKVIVDKPDAYNSTGNFVTAFPSKSISGNIQVDGLKHIRKKIK